MSLNMSANQLAEAIGVPANRISDIVRERRGVSADPMTRPPRSAPSPTMALSGPRAWQS